MDSLILKLNDNTITLTTHNTEQGLMYKAQDLLKGYGLSPKQSSKKLENWKLSGRYPENGTVIVKGGKRDLQGTYLTAEGILSLLIYLRKGVITEEDLQPFNALLGAKCVLSSVLLNINQPRDKTKERASLSTIEQITNCKLTLQYPIKRPCGGLYFIDGYDEVNNIAYEIDEQHHFIDEELKTTCQERQNYIESKLNCKFVRVEV